MALDLGPGVLVTRDAQGVVRGLNHLDAPHAPGRASSSAALAVAYLREAAEVFGIDATIEAKRAPSPTAQPKPADDRPQLLLTESTSLLGATTHGFSQWLHGLQVWEAGASVTVRDDPLGVVTARSEYRQDMKVAELLLDAEVRPGKLSAGAAAELLGRKDLRLNSKGRWWLYRYDPAERHLRETAVKDARTGREQGPPTLRLPAVPRGIEPGVHYQVLEILFDTEVPRWGVLHWRAFVEPRTRAVLYVRAFVACATGLVYLTDPTVQGGSRALKANAATTAQLDAERRTVTLLGLQAPSGGTQALRGEFVVVQDTNLPTVAPPTTTSPFDFAFTSTSDGFAAAATYHHCDAMFRLVQNSGFTVSTYFASTTFPVPVDHRGRTDINASCEGNATGNGVGKMIFGPCDAGTAVGMGCEGRTVMHEFCHALLWDSVSSPNFGFAHSAGDSIAMIATDPFNRLTGLDRFVVYTFCPLGTDRRADRDVAAGWAWGGSKDGRGYDSEEILATTMFRLYRSLGGDSTRQEVREFASRYCLYLIIRAIGSLATSPITPTPLPGSFADAVMTADRLTTAWEGFSGGAMHKVVRWSFERQGLYQVPARPAGTVVARGAPPDVDVYIDDGRSGEYEFRENFWDTTDIWNRAVGDGGTSHEDPVVGQPSFVYVRVRNRGRLPAGNVTVRGFHSRPMTGLVWPADWQPMTTASIHLGATTIAAGGSTVVGPFEWTPTVVGHECLLMDVSADGDRSVIDPTSGTVTGSIPHWRLVPFDNNVAQRNVAPIRRLTKVTAELERLGFEIANTTRRKVLVEIETRIPRALAKAGWRLTFDGLEAERLVLAPKKRLHLVPRLQRGGKVVARDLDRDGSHARIEVTVLMDGVVAGGMTYPIEDTRR